MRIAGSRARRRAFLPAAATLAVAGVVLYAQSARVTGLYPATPLSVLVETSDLPGGWSRGGFGFDLHQLGGPRCSGPDPIEAALARESAQFSNGSRFLSQAVGVFRDTGGAAEALRTYTEFVGCSRNVDGGAGNSLTLHAKPTSAPRIGDESHAYRVDGTMVSGTGSDLSGSLGADVVMFRSQNVLEVVAQMTTPSAGAREIPHQDTINVAKAASAKLGRLARVAGPLESEKELLAESAANVHGATAPADSVTPAAATPATTPSGGPLALGQSATLEDAGHGIKVVVTVLKLVDPGTGDLYEPKPGFRFVGVQMRIGNVGATPYEDSPGNGAVLIADDEQQYPEAVATITEGPGFDGHVRIAPDDARKGFLVFELPEGVGARSLQFALDSGFGAASAEWSLAG